MNKKAHQSFTELEVWKKGRDLKNELKKLTEAYPSEEKFRLQIKRFVHPGLLRLLFRKVMEDILLKTRCIFVL